MSQDDVIVDRTVYPDYAQDEGKKVVQSLRSNCDCDMGNEELLAVHCGQVHGILPNDQRLATNDSPQHFHPTCWQKTSENSFRSTLF
jgi:hypothetical protein